MIRMLHILSFCMLFIVGMQAQSEPIEGSVSFLTSSNTYVRFNSTEGIEAGDTLTVLVEGEYKACLIVEQKSSTSCVCKKIEECQLEKNAKVYFRKREEKAAVLDAVDVPNSINNLETEIFDTDSLQAIIIEPVVEKKESRQQINARLSASSYSSLDDVADRHRLMTRFSFNADKINDSNFSFESYMNYRRNLDNTNPEDPRNSFFRVYNLAVRYESDSLETSIVFGRSINPRMSSVGAIDGIQVNKYFNRLYAGAIVGFRPDIIEFDFNPNLLEYGFYIGADLSPNGGYGRITAGVLEQRNGSAIDRRYSYFQLSNNFGRKLNVFASGEIDLYSSDLVSSSYSPKLTNILISTQYRFSRKFSLSLAFDSRKRIIFYETLRTDLERLLADDEARQGIRARVSLRPIKYFFVGASYSKRFQNSAQNKSDNYNAFISMSRLPLVNGRLNVGYNLNKSNFQNTSIWTIRHSRTIIKRKLDIDAYYRYVKYDYFNTETIFDQYYLGAGLNWNITRDLGFSLLIEHSSSDTQDRNRINTKLIKRFRSN